MKYTEAIKLIGKVNEQGIKGTELRPSCEAAKIVIEKDIENLIMNVYKDLNDSQKEKIEHYFETIINTIDQIFNSNSEAIHNFNNIKLWAINETKKEIEKIVK